MREEDAPPGQGPRFYISNFACLELDAQLFRCWNQNFVVIL